MSEGWEMGRPIRSVPSNFYLRDHDFSHIREILKVKRLSQSSINKIQEALFKYHIGKNNQAESKYSQQNKAGIAKAIKRGKRRLLRPWDPASIQDFKESLDSLDDQTKLDLRLMGIKNLDPVNEAERIYEKLSKILLYKSPKGRPPNIPLHNLIYSLCIIYENITSHDVGEKFSFNPRKDPPDRYSGPFFHFIDYLLEKDPTSEYYENWNKPALGEQIKRVFNFIREERKNPPKPELSAISEKRRSRQIVKARLEARKLKKPSLNPNL